MATAPTASIRIHASAALLILALSVLMTWPVALHMTSYVRDVGDPLLNSWILAWDVRQLLAADVSHFFDANIFYPHRRTLAYSEILLPQSLIAAAPLLASDNPILAYNVVFLFSFFFSGFSMYLFARHLAGTWAGGVIAGIVFAFSPFLFDHLSHVQILFAGGIPLTFWFLSRFFVGGRLSDAFAAALCFVIQLLGNNYYAVYSCFFVALTVLFHGIAARKWVDVSFLGKLAAFAAVTALACGPVFYQYMLFKEEMSFQREIVTQAELRSYVAAPAVNALYGGLGFGDDLPEARLFPGFSAMILAAVGVGGIRWRRPRDPAPRADRDRHVRVSFRALFYAAIGLLVLVMVVVLTRGRFLLEISSSSLERPFLLLLLLVAVRAAVDRRFRQWLLKPLIDADGWRQFLGFLLCLSVLLSFGMRGPYRWLYEYVPGFDNLRSIARIHVYTMFSLAVLAAFGARQVLARVGEGRRALVGILLSALVLVEYWSVPVPLESVPVKEMVPAVYRWLAQQEGETPVLELPLRTDYRPGCERVYFSTYHWKPIANGFSGFHPPLFEELKRRWSVEPPVRTIRDAQALGIRYLVLHTLLMRPEEIDATRSALLAMTGEARFVASFEGDEVWELVPGRSSRSAASRFRDRDALGRRNWKVESSDPELAHLMLDGDLSTRWHSGRPQTPGIWLTVDLGESQPVRAVSMTVGESRLDFPRGYEVELSPDGEQWSRVAVRELDLLPIEAYLRPRELAIDIRFAPAVARFVRITTTRSDPIYHWSVYEIEIFS